MAIGKRLMVNGTRFTACSDFIEGLPYENCQNKH